MAENGQLPEMQSLEVQRLNSCMELATLMPQIANTVAHLENAGKLISQLPPTEQSIHVGDLQNQSKDVERGGNRIFELLRNFIEATSSIHSKSLSWIHENLGNLNSIKQYQNKTLI